MFSTKLDALLLSLSGKEQMKLFPPYMDREAWRMVEPRRAAYYEARASRAYSEGMEPLCLSDAADLFDGGSRVFEDAQTARREQLKAIAMECLISGGDIHLFARMVDLIYALCEEAFWGPPKEYAGLSEGHELNEVSISTAGLLAGVAYMFGGIFMPALESALRFASLAVNARVLKPFLKRDDFSIFRAENMELPCHVEHVLTAILVMGDNDHERWLCVRKAIAFLDQYLMVAPKSAYYGTSVEKHLDAACAFSFCVDLIHRASNREIEFRVDPAYRKLVNLPCSLHITGRWFVSGGTGSMEPDISPDSLYEMARFAGDRDLMGLAAALSRHIKEESAIKGFSSPTQPFLRQVHQALIRGAFLKQPAREPMYEEVALSELPLYAMRSQGFYMALSGSRPWAGAFMLFFEDMPVLFEVPGLTATEDHTLPTIDGVGQSLKGDKARDASADEKGMYTMISMNIASAYEKRADLTSWQRTLLLMPLERGVRLMEVYDFDVAEHRVAFHFITPHKPTLFPDEVRLGPVTLRWEGDLEAQSVRLPVETQAYRLTLNRNQPVRSGSETFIFTVGGRGK